MITRNILLVAIVGFLCVISNANPNRDEGDTSLGRLPVDLWPIHYVLEIQPDYYSSQPPFFFNGSVDITFECVTATNIIYLSSRDLIIDEASLYIIMDPGSPIQVPQPIIVRTEIDAPLEFYKIFLEDYLVPDGEYQLGMRYDGPILTPNDQVGLFYTTYTSIINGSTVYQLVTQMQPCDARRVFPHFDEPMFKATFDTTVVRKSHVIALSNGNLISSEDRGNDWVADTFNTTVKMSSYLNCIIIGVFDYLESTSASGMPIRVWARPEYANDLQLANRVAAGMHDFYEQYTDYIDPMPKLDHIAVPGFQVGAMENWGLIPYGEFYMLYNETMNTQSDERVIASVIGHETAHLWFGDLVTTRWWTDLWLNEGFATFYEELAYDTVWGESSNDHALVSEQRDMLNRDSSVTSAPVRREVNTPWDPTYSSFTYGKGAATLRMLRQILGDTGLRDAIRRYMQRYAFDNVVTDDFWQVLTEQAELDGITDSDGGKLFIKEKMDPMVDQIGYPLVTFTRTAPSTADVTQTYFLSPPDQTPPASPFNYEWFIPVTLTSRDSADWNPYPATRDWLNRENKVVTNGIPASMTEWFVANIDQSGFYRVKYDNATYFQLVDQLDTDITAIPSSNRFSLLNDAFELARAGLETEVFAMETTRSLDQEDNFVVWDTADIHLSYPALMLARYSTFTQWASYMVTKVDPLYTRMGWDNTGSNNLERSLRGLAVELACNYGNTDCALEARTRFDGLMATPSVNTIAVDHRYPVYCTSVRGGSQADWDGLHSLYTSIKTSVLRDIDEEQDRIINALACSEDDVLLQRYIDMTFDPAQFEDVHLTDVLRAVASANRGRWVLWQHFNNTWTNNPVPAGADKWRPLQDIVKGFATDQDILDLEAFIVKYPAADQSETDQYNEALATANANNAWANTHRADLELWLQGHTGVTGYHTPYMGGNHGARQRLAQIKDARHKGRHNKLHTL